jgi:hypothetical protein
MGKLAQYRLLKKVKKMLDTPVKNEQTYDAASSPMYIGDKSYRGDEHESNPIHSMRRTKVNEIASMLLEQICRMEKLFQDGHDAVCDKDNSNVVIENAFIDIHIALAELDDAILFTEAERISRRQHLAKLQPKSDSGPDRTGNDEGALALLRLQIEDWQLENTRKQRKVSRVETTIRDLGLNVHDVRCAQILREKKEAVAASEAAIAAGGKLCRETCRMLEEIFQ